MSRIKAILFDLGGTLLYPDYPFVQKEFAAHGQTLTLNAFLHSLSVASTRVDEYMRHHVTTDATRVPLYMRYILEELGAPFDIETFVQQKGLPHHQTVNFWNYRQEGTLELLERLRQRFQLAMISNSDGRAEAKARQYGLAQHLDFVMDSHLVGIEKPDPRIFALAGERMNLRPEQCAYVGDIYAIDVVGSRAAGMLPILIDKTASPREDCVVIETLFDLEKLDLLREN